MTDVQNNEVKIENVRPKTPNRIKTHEEHLIDRVDYYWTLWSDDGLLIAESSYTFETREDLLLHCVEVFGASLVLEHHVIEDDGDKTLLLSVLESLGS